MRTSTSQNVELCRRIVSVARPLTAIVTTSWTFEARAKEADDEGRAARKFKRAFETMPRRDPYSAAFHSKPSGNDDPNDPTKGGGGFGGV